MCVAGTKVAALIEYVNSQNGDYRHILRTLHSGKKNGFEWVLEESCEEIRILEVREI